MKLKIVFLLLYLSCANLVIGQESYVAKIKHYTTKQGLSHLDVFSFEKDSNNVIWIGTRNGLNRFDGRNFKIFTTENGLAHDNVNKLFADKEILWCIHTSRNTYTKSASLFHTTKQKVISFKDFFGDKIPFSATNIIDVDVFKKKLIIRLKNGDAYLYAKGVFTQLSFLNKNDIVCGIANDGSFWTYNKNQKKIHLKKWTTKGRELFIKKITELETPLAKTFSLIHEDEHRNSHFGYRTVSNENRVWVIIDAEENLQIKKSTVRLEAKEEVSLITYMTKYSPYYKGYWYSIVDTCMLLSPQKKVLYKGFFRVKNNTNSFLDKQTIWQASQGKGFYQIQLKENKFKNFFVNENGSFRGITKINNTIYFNSYKKLYTKKEEIDIRGFATIKGKDSTIWMSLGPRLTQYTSQLKELKNKITPLRKVGKAEIWSLFQDKNGLIWYSNIGLSAYNPKTGEVKKVANNGFNAIDKSIVYYFYKQKDGTVLLCTTTGLYKMNVETGITERYWNGGKGKYYLPTNDIRHLYIDEKTNNYWFATHRKGLLQWNPSTRKYKTFLFNNSQTNIVHSVYSDKNGFLWMSTEYGIVQFHKENKTFKVYTEEDGIASNEFNRISHYKDNDTGIIYFGSINGVTTFYPNDFKTTFYSKESTKVIPIEINQFSAKTEKIENTTYNFYQKNKIELLPNDRFLTIILGLSNYKYSEKTTYYYKLKNIDKNWIKAIQNNLTLSGLPYGEQILQVKALLPNGQFTLTTTEIPIAVFKPFYLEWWFFVMSFLCIFSLVIIYVRWRTAKLHYQKVALREEVAKRTIQIQKQAEELMELDKTKSRFFANISHELRTPITLIKGPIQSILKNKKLTKKDTDLLIKAKNNTNSLLRLVNEILTLTKLEGEKLQLEESTIVLRNFIKQVSSNFQSIADANQIQFTLQYKAEKELQIKIDAYKLEKILNNLLSNAFKFTQKEGKVTIIVEDKGETLLLKVVDTGRGIPAEDIPYIFERYFQSSKNKKAEGGLGIGLALSMELVKFLQGKMWVESITEGNNKGTSFFVELPKIEVMAMLQTEDVIALEKETTKPNTSKLIAKQAKENKAFSTILLVEDNKDLREYIQLLLRPFYNVVTAENGQQALHLLTTTKLPNLIISDLMMPVMDGYELLEKVKKNKKLNGIPFIVLTARAELKDKLKALRIGVDDYLLKPFEEEELLARAENLLINYAERLAFIEVQQEHDSALFTGKDSKATEWLMLLEKTIKENIDNSLFSNDYLAEIMQVSRKKIYSKIKTLTGLTPNQYIRTIRLQLAKEYLENGTYKTVKEVSNKVGFKKQGHFSNLFKQEFGKSPAEYLR